MIEMASQCSDLHAAFIYFLCISCFINNKSLSFFKYFEESLKYGYWKFINYIIIIRVFIVFQ